MIRFIGQINLGAKHCELNKTRNLIFESVAPPQFQKLKFGFNEFVFLRERNLH